MIISHVCQLKALDTVKYRRKFLLVQLIVCLLWLSLSHISMADAVRCQDKSGNVIFTDDARLCYGTDRQSISITTSPNKSIPEKSIPNKKAKANFRVPQRDYQKESSAWNIHIEKSLIDGDPALAQQSIKKLKDSLDKIFIALPDNPASRLKGVDFYLMWGKSSPYGGRKSGMSYIREGEPLNYPYLDPRWNHAIIIYSAKNLVYLTELWAKKALMHELAHAWHITNWPENHPPIVNAYQNAKSLGLYANVKDNKGNVISKTYALKNPLEYFAELSAIYFMGGNYYPFSRDGLSKHDGLGFGMISKLWRG